MSRTNERGRFWVSFDAMFRAAAETMMRLSDGHCSLHFRIV
jgi:hypothetical protein